MNRYDEIPDWLKSKGYLHLSPSLKIGENWRAFKRQIENKEFVSKFAFYPLMHTLIKERKYKKADEVKHMTLGRAHKHIAVKNNKTEQTYKLRPLHYASHYDALVYGFYAHILNEKYLEKLSLLPELLSCITAYRKIKLEENSDKGKSTIHFAKEVFDEIKRRTSNDKKIAVLTFDIKGFFSSLDHKILKQKWSFMIDEKSLPSDHYNVFKSCTNFSYVLKDDLRKLNNKNGRKSGFDERKLAKIRREKGFKCFFESNEDFRNHIKQGKLRVFKNPFRRQDSDNKKQIVGIPQGLPISATLANIYLYDFDKAIIENLVEKENAYYRRYSDDIVVICDVEKISSTKQFVENLIKESKVEISTSKTETFIFENIEFNDLKERRLTSIKINNDGSKSTDSPLIYLGFEFRGYNVLIKSTNLAKYYRRLISIIKRRANRAKKGINKYPFQKKAIFLNQVKKLYNRPLREIDSETGELKQKLRTKSVLELNERGEYSMISSEVQSQRKNSNYMGYVRRCSEIFETEDFEHQLRKRKHIVFTAIYKHLK
ncbi:reverse transcriptase domain-containing protein [Kaistella antarctica]|uniref:DNA polymerase n=1 Tax=Kaistella antarctica TaxID=266748 RepID=A0A3S5EUR2_9FLAO|nr:reverse transcriptase domain-containing protein [Kaistella antarctica]KEY19111.1 DNA polymerase [Kaistella antarctica]SEW02814.1 Reverse transcriptase (RNA-dependent DNA polymerase) [Kaistella antarctica]VEH98869.1 Retron-type reverse transcriptase [Kaistella antarctica]